VIGQVRSTHAIKTYNFPTHFFNNATDNSNSRPQNTILPPIIGRFITAFDGYQDQDFWAHIASPEFQGSGHHTLGGWITAFCVFQEDGKFNGNTHVENTWVKEKRYVLDGAVYPIVGEEDIPRERAEVNINLIDQGGNTHPTVLVVGNLGMKVHGPGGGITVQNVPMWCCYLNDRLGLRKSFLIQVPLIAHESVKSTSNNQWCSLF